MYYEIHKVIMSEQYSSAENMAMKAVSLSAFSAINIVDIKHKVKSLLSLIGRDGVFDEYTKHDISHIDGMLASLDFIIPEKVKGQLTGADWLLPETDLLQNRKSNQVPYR